jgi:hypothetical protein
MGRITSIESIKIDAGRSYLENRHCPGFPVLETKTISRCMKNDLILHFVLSILYSFLDKELTN